MKTMRMYMRGLLVGTIFLMGSVALQSAAFGGAGVSKSGEHHAFLGCVARGDTSLKIYYGPSKRLLRDAIVESGWQHVEGKAENIYWVTPERAASLQAAIDAAPDVFYVVEGEEFVERTEREPIPGGFAGTTTVRVRTSDNKGLLLQAINDSNLGLAHKDNVFYVAARWHLWLNQLTSTSVIPYPWTTAQKAIAVVVLGSAAALACSIQ